ncbi:MAG TPA: Gfo/Idh/MocA family oxidoreductase [Myxococcales bacterium]|nr:Gfo/Idh/MocA family oxidoreductase [Myxococcales bacterium]
MASKRTNGRKSSGRKIGYAVVGLGHIAQTAVLPAFAHAKNSRLVALLSDDEDKREKLSRKYECDACSYEQYEECLARDEVDAVYIALPNTMHAEYTVRAAASGVHVLCEKPMATNEADCRRMITACDDAGVRLMIAYRLHFEPANLEAIRMVKSGRLGEPRFFSSDFSYQVKEDNIRTQAELGGGPIWDIGVYCINAARYLFRAEPFEVMAFATRGSDRRFDEGVPAGMSCLMRFGDEQLATFNVSFQAAPTDTYRIVGTKGDLCLDEAYEYQGKRELIVTIDDQSRTRTFPQVDQFAPELVYFSDCVLRDTEPEPSGEEGLADVRVVEALLRSAEDGRPVRLASFKRRFRPEPRMKMRKPPVREPEPVHADSPVG